MIYRELFKRWVDLALATIAVVCLVPLMLIVSIMIKCFDPGTVIFRQHRVGRLGKVFTIYKFRSMPVTTIEVSSDKICGVKWTWIGLLIRRLNIDELPQLINIIRGDMSVVGPRPSLVSQTKLNQIRNEKGVSLARPGLTGLAQINSFDGMSLEDKVAWDERYCSNITLFSDLIIIFKTVLYLFRSPPKY